MGLGMAVARRTGRGRGWRGTGGQSPWRAVAGLALLAALVGCQRVAPPLGGADAPARPATFAGTATCARCHPREAEAVRGSHHGRAMQVADERTVLGDFGGVTVTDGGVTATFLRRAGAFWVRTEGPDGRTGDFRVAYTFGVEPLQQYLLPLPGGRLQAFGLAWDTRPRAEGGQRWFALYPGRGLRPGDPLHWTGRDQTWNFQCAECHSTGLRKGYDPEGDRYRTTWAELPVACEACHGPGSAHVTWAEGRRREAGPAGPGQRGLPVRLGRPPGTWTMTARGTAAWQGLPRDAAEVDACGRCHARRRPIVEPYPYGRPLLDTHVPALLEPGLYHADGQIRGEVYEWGSFVQTRMFRAGVTCADCHEPHGGTLRAPGNALCGACHLPARFEAASHHRHPPGSAGARCVSCHMPARTVMAVDRRRDHGFPVPRPDLAVALGTPEPCTGCHQDRAPEWAAAEVARWRGGAAARPHFAPALEAGRRGDADAGPALVRLATDRDQPGIARATALGLLAEHLAAPGALTALEAGLADPDALVRMAAADATLGLAPAPRARLAASALLDPVRAVRLAAARALADVPRGSLGEGERRALAPALAELVAAERVNADRPEAHVNLAVLHERLGRPGDAEAALRTALRLAPDFVPALLGLADLLRARGRDAEGEPLLVAALRAAPDDPEALAALGRRRARQGRWAEALVLLGRATAAAPEAPHLARAHAAALHAAGQADRAIEVLEAAHRRRPADREVLKALAAFLAERGDVDRARDYAERLVGLAPDDPEARALRDALRDAPPR
jgi:predicted CXXCH cytochrome family protein